MRDLVGREDNTVNKLTVINSSSDLSNYLNITEIDVGINLRVDNLENKGLAQESYRKKDN